MGWNLQTWLWGAVVLCGLLAFISDTSLQADRRKTFLNGEPLEFELKMLETKIQKNHGLRLVCGYLALFCVTTAVLFT